MALIGYTGEVFPKPEGNLHSSLADQKNTNNITGFKNKRADEIMEAYEKEFDVDEPRQAAARARRHLYQRASHTFSCGALRFSGSCSGTSSGIRRGW